MIILNSLNDPKLVRLYNNGAVGILPTDTIYGITASAHNIKAVDRLYGLKTRQQKPGTVITASVDQLYSLGVPPKYLGQVAHLWPNPLSIEMPIGKALDYISQGTGHGAFRVVANPQIKALLQKTGPLLTTSANHPGQPAADNIAEALTYFRNKVDFYVDGGHRPDNPPSTVVRLIPETGKLEIIRIGALNINENGEIL